MHLSSDLVTQFIEKIKSKVLPYEFPHEDGIFHVHRLDDIILTLTEGGEVYGLNFEVLGKDFVVTPDLTVMYTNLNDIEKSIVFYVQDVRLISALNDFIEWRIAVFELEG